MIHNTEMWIVFLDLVFVLAPPKLATYNEDTSISHHPPPRPDGDEAYAHSPHLHLRPAYANDNSDSHCTSHSSGRVLCLELDVLATENPSPAPTLHRRCTFVRRRCTIRHVPPKSPAPCGSSVCAFVIVFPPPGCTLHLNGSTCNNLDLDAHVETKIPAMIDGRGCDIGQQARPRVWW